MKLRPWAGSVRVLVGLLLLAVLGAGEAAPQVGAGPVDPEKSESQRAYADALEAIQASDWARAELMLERSLMLDPDHAGALLELSGLLARRGRLEAARAMMRALIDDPRTPPEYRARLEALLAGPVPRALPGGAGPTFIGEAYAGWTSNPFARSDVRELTLTFPEGAVTLPVQTMIRPQSLAGLAFRGGDPDRWTLSVGAEQLSGQEGSGAHRVAFSARLPWRLSQSTGLDFSAQSYRGHDGNSRHGMGLAAVGSGWRLSVGGFREPLTDRSGSVLRIESTSRPARRLDLLAYADLESVSGAGSGFGRVGALAQWSPAADWTLSTHLSAQQDFAAYSPWLGNGARRSLQTAYLALERSWALEDPRWRLLGRIYGGVRRSNISLFGYNEQGAVLSIQRRWP